MLPIKLVNILIYCHNFFSVTHQKVDADNIYWWSDAQFLPYDDTVLFVTSGPFEPRSQHAWVNLRHAPNGRVIKMDLDRKKLGNLFLLFFCVFFLC